MAKWFRESKSHAAFLFVSLEERPLKFGADLVTFDLPLLEVSFELVRGETHHGVFVLGRGAMATHPRVLETLGCGGSPPGKTDVIKTLLTQ